MMSNYSFVVFALMAAVILQAHAATLREKRSAEAQANAPADFAQAGIESGQQVVQSSMDCMTGTANGAAEGAVAASKGDPGGTFQGGVKGAMACPMAAMDMATKIGGKFMEAGQKMAGMAGGKK